MEQDEDGSVLGKQRPDPEKNQEPSGNLKLFQTKKIKIKINKFLKKTLYGIKRNMNIEI